MGVALITREARRLKPGAPVREAPGLTTNNPLVLRQLQTVAIVLRRNGSQKEPGHLRGHHP